MRHYIILAVLFVLSMTIIMPASGQNEEIQTTVAGTGIVLTLDTSDSMSGTPLKTAREAMMHFVRRVDGNFPLAVTTFSSRVAVVQDFTNDEEILTQSISALTLGGVTALYDGSVRAIEVAAASGTSQPIVVLLSDGAEYGGQSESARGAALDLAKAQNVTVYTIGLGYGVDRTYLQELASGTGGQFFEVEEAANLTVTFDAIYDAIYATIPTPAAVIDTEQNGITPLAEAPIPGLQDSLQLQPVIESINRLPLSFEELMRQNTLRTDTVALDASSTADAIDSTSLASTAVDGTAATVTDATLENQPLQPDTLQGDVRVPQTDKFYIQVDTGDVTYSEAALRLNDTLLATFFEKPYEYALDSDVIVAGSYRLTFSAQTENDTTVADDLTFEIASTETRTGEPRLVLMVEGVEHTLNLSFSPETGLAFRAPVDATTAAAVGPARNFIDILKQPIQHIPQPVKDAVTKQRPVLVTVVIIIMTVILLPQGIFTLYWMTYSWVHPERFEKSGAPAEYTVPRYSFTALVPARKEAAVIYDTIRTVAGINYPEDLKETLIMVRDEDDDATIERTLVAIEDIRQEYISRGEEYPDNIHLITFTDGPKNKPNGLNRGYKVATKDVICIFDAEDHPHADIYNAVNTKMIHDNADVVQSGVQLMNFKTNWFSGFNVLEYFFWFKSGLHAYTDGLNVTPLGGNTVFFKKEWLDELAKEDKEKGYRVWNENRLTEDADIGLRLTSKGAKIQIMYDAKLATREETPSTVTEFIKQRTRWCQGFYEIFMDGYWMGLPTLKQRIASIYILLNSILQGFILVFLPVGLYIGLFQQVPVPIALLSWLPIFLLLIQLVLSLIGIREFTLLYGERLPLFFRWRMVLFYYPYQLMLAASAVRAVYRFLTNQSAWEKTTHSNLHRNVEVATVQRGAI